MIKLGLSDRENLEQKAESFSKDLWAGMLTGVGTALVITSGLAFYYAKTQLNMDIPQCCLYTAMIDVLASKPIILTGGAAGALAGSLTYYARRKK